jgi:hypothetical protein
MFEHPAILQQPIADLAAVCDQALTDQQPFRTNLLKGLHQDRNMV